LLINFKEKLEALAPFPIKTLLIMCNLSAGLVVPIPILPLEWNTNIKTIHFQYELPNYKKRKLRELYFDYELSFGEWDKIEDPDYKIFNSLENTKMSKINSKGNIVFCDSEDNNTFEFYKKELHQKGKGFNWFKLWDYCWIVSK
jgi:hypothetical protein